MGHDMTGDTCLLPTMGVTHAMNTLSSGRYCIGSKGDENTNCRTGLRLNCKTSIRGCSTSPISSPHSRSRGCTPPISPVINSVVDSTRQEDILAHTGELSAHFVPWGCASGLAPVLETSFPTSFRDGRRGGVNLTMNPAVSVVLEHLNGKLSSRGCNAPPTSRAASCSRGCTPPVSPAINVSPPGYQCEKVGASIHRRLKSVAYKLSADDVPWGDALAAA